MFSFGQSSTPAASRYSADEAASFTTLNILKKINTSFQNQRELKIEPGHAKKKDVDKCLVELKTRYALVQEMMFRDARADESGGSIADCTVLENDFLTSDSAVDELINVLTASIELQEELPLHADLDPSVVKEGEVITMVTQSVCSHRRRANITRRFSSDRPSRNDDTWQTLAARISRALPNVSLLIRWLNPSLSFLTRYNACRLFGSLVQFSGSEFLEQVVSAGTGLTCINQMLQSVDDGNLLRTAAVQLVLRLTRPSNFIIDDDEDEDHNMGQRSDSMGSVPRNDDSKLRNARSGFDDDGEDVVYRRMHRNTDLKVSLQCLLAFDGCFDLLLNIIEDEGGLSASDRSIFVNDSVPYLTVLVDDIVGGPFNRRDATASTAPGLIGKDGKPEKRRASNTVTMNTVLDCVRCIKQLMEENDQTTGLFIRMGFVVKLQKLIVLPTSCVELPPERRVFLPPFTRPCTIRGATRYDGAVAQRQEERSTAVTTLDYSRMHETVDTTTEAVLMDVSFLLLHCTYFATRNDADRVNFVKQLSTQSELLDQILQWITYISNAHMRGTKCFVTARGLSVLWNYLFILDYALLQTPASRRGTCDYILQKEIAAVGVHSARGWGPDFGPGMNRFLGIPQPTTLRAALMLLIYWRRHSPRTDYASLSHADGDSEEDGPDPVDDDDNASDADPVSTSYEELLADTAQATFESLLLACSDDKDSTDTLARELTSFPIPRRIYSAHGVYCFGLALQRLRARGDGSLFYTTTNQIGSMRAIAWLQYFTRFIQNAMTFRFATYRSVHAFVAVLFTMSSFVDAYVESSSRAKHRDPGEDEDSFEERTKALEELENEISTLTGLLLKAVSLLSQASVVSDQRIVPVVRAAVSVLASQVLINKLSGAEEVDARFAEVMHVTAGSIAQDVKAAAANVADGYGSTVANVLLSGCGGASGSGPVGSPTQQSSPLTKPKKPLFDSSTFAEFMESWRSQSPLFAAIETFSTWVGGDGGDNNATPQRSTSNAVSSSSFPSASAARATDLQSDDAASNGKQQILDLWYLAWIEFTDGTLIEKDGEDWQSSRRSVTSRNYPPGRSTGSVATTTRTNMSPLATGDRAYMLVSFFVTEICPYRPPRVSSQSTWTTQRAAPVSTQMCVQYVKEVLGDVEGRRTATTHIPASALEPVFNEVRQLDTFTRQKRAQAAISSSHAKEMGQVKSELEQLQDEVASLRETLIAKEELISSQTEDIDALCRLLVKTNAEHSEHLLLMKKLFTS